MAVTAASTLDRTASEADRADSAAVSLDEKSAALPCRTARSDSLLAIAGRCDEIPSRSVSSECSSATAFASSEPAAPLPPRAAESLARARAAASRSERMTFALDARRSTSRGSVSLTRRSARSTRSRIEGVPPSGAAPTASSRRRSLSWTSRSREDGAGGAGGAAESAPAPRSASLSLARSSDIRVDRSSCLPRSWADSAAASPAPSASRRDRSSADAARRSSSCP
mmetsp:Transcript_20448/g.46214  ORF Transcript_20448/g.46214 Transcript_20448/m.46214 type:complete len:226 (-) Transcript_20448:439-1116(-)